MREFTDDDFAVLTDADIKMMERAATPGVIYVDFDPSAYEEMDDA